MKFYSFDLKLVKASSEGDQISSQANTEMCLANLCHRGNFLLAFLLIVKNSICHCHQLFNKYCLNG